MFTFLNGLDDDLRKALLIQLRNLWTHTSTAIEGNTLTLGETAFVLEEGLTISGKPLKDHEEVVGHAIPDEIQPFRQFCHECWAETIALVKEVRYKQQERNQRR